MPDRPAMDPDEIARDLTNWLDTGHSHWRTLDPAARLNLLARAAAYFEEVTRRYRIPEPEYLPPLRAAERSVRQANGF
jgi:hypothetical protein